LSPQRASLPRRVPLSHRLLNLSPSSGPAAPRIPRPPVSSFPAGPPPHPLIQPSVAGLHPAVTTPSLATARSPTSRRSPSAAYVSSSSSGSRTTSSWRRSSLPRRSDSAPRGQGQGGPIQGGLGPAPK